MNRTAASLAEGTRIMYVGSLEVYRRRLGTIIQNDKSGLPYYIEIDSEGPDKTTFWTVDDDVLPVPNVGDYVFPAALVRDDGSDDWYGIPEVYRDKPGRVTEVVAGNNAPVITAEFTSHQKPDDTIAWAFCDWRPADGHTLNVSEQEATPVERRILTDLQRQIDSLTRELERANERVEQYSLRAGQWERDFMKSWERIGLEAVERGWCSEYEEVVDDVQATLEIGEIPRRKRLVERRLRITGTVYKDITVWVEEDDDVTDPDNWYASDDSDDKCSDEFLTETLDSEHSDNGWDDTEVRER